jgi:hypothetical protein
MPDCSLVQQHDLGLNDGDACCGVMQKLDVVILIK